MSDPTTYGTTVPSLGRAGADARTVFGQTMGLVAVTTGFFAIGSYVGRHLTHGWGWVFFVGAFATLLAMRYAVQKAGSSAVALLFAFGSFIGLGTAPTVAYYAGANPRVVWEAGAGAALLIAALGAVGYGARRDLTPLARLSSWGLVALVVFGIVSILAQVPNGALVYAVVGLVVFAGLTVVDFQRLKLAGEVSTAPLLAASIFLDTLNVFLFFLTIFDSER
jgi:modulator of FtsH protease